MCDHAHIQLEKEYSNTDFICNRKPVAQRVLLWENAFSSYNAPVICIPGSPGAGDSGDIAGLKCLALTADVSRQCRGFAGVTISRQYTVTLIQIRF